MRRKIEGRTFVARNAKGPEVCGGCAFNTSEPCTSLNCGLSYGKVWRETLWSCIVTMTLEDNPGEDSARVRYEGR